MHLVFGCLFTSLNNRGNYPRSFLDTMKKNFQPAGLLVLSLLYLTEHPATQPDTEHIFLEWQKKQHPNPPKQQQNKKTQTILFPPKKKKTQTVKTFPGGRTQLRCWAPTPQLVHRARRTTRGQDPSDGLALPRTRTTLP